MSTQFVAVQWNPFKKKYDLILWLGNLLFLSTFTITNLILFPHHNINTILIRGLGLLSVLLLHLILIIGPLSRLDARFLPILYNRRHLGVSMFLLAASHGLLSLLWFHGGGNTDLLSSLFLSNTHYFSLQFFPFQTLGFAALLILAMMAATSHDFWLGFLSPLWWKAMHMLVYLAYALVMLHIVTGILQFEDDPLLIALLYAGMIMLCTLHIFAAWKERKPIAKQKDWIPVANLDEFIENRAKTVCVNQRRVAVFLYDGKLSAVDDQCKHQMGPLSEGKIVDGCITCPWHGYQYRPEDGRSPAPFTEKVATYRLALDHSKVYIDPNPLPEGTPIEPLQTGQASPVKKHQPFFIGWQNRINKIQLAFLKKVIVTFSGFLLLMAVTTSLKQQKISPYQIDYGTVRKVEGWLSAKPVPMLTVLTGKDGMGNPVFKSILLVDALKHGANETVNKALQGASSAPVSIMGYVGTTATPCGNGHPEASAGCLTTISGEHWSPIMEIENGVLSINPIPAPPIKPMESIGAAKKQITLTGEIIDPKCYFGAMNPGSGKPHLSCAVRCIDGGIMPVIKYQANGIEQFALLLSETGTPVNNQVLPFIGLPVKVVGKLSSYNNWHILYISSLETNPKKSWTSSAF